MYKSKGARSWLTLLLFDPVSIPSVCGRLSRYSSGSFFILKTILNKFARILGLLITTIFICNTLPFTKRVCITYYSPKKIRCYFFEKITRTCPSETEILHFSSIISLLTPSGNVLSSLYCVRLYLVPVVVITALSP